MHRAQRHQAHGFDALFPQYFPKTRKPRFGAERRDQQGLLRVHDQSARRFLDRQFPRGPWFGRPCAFANANLHDLALRVVEHEADEIEGHDAMEFLRQVMEKRGQVAVLGNRLGHFEQRAQPLLEAPRRPRGLRITHKGEDSIPARRASRRRAAAGLDGTIPARAFRGGRFWQPE